MTQVAPALPGHVLVRHAPRPGELRVAARTGRTTLLVLALPLAGRAGIVG